MNDHDRDFQCAPVLLICFNRPDFLCDLIATIAPARPSRVFVAVDGPRADHPNDEVLCARTRSAIDAIDWPCEVQTLFHERNLGCMHAPPEAITWFFSQVSAGIILEDDIRPSISFLRFASELLERYSDDARIGMISAANPYGFITAKDDSYLFTKDVAIWGWASWARVWKHYDVEPEHYIGDFESIVSRTFVTSRGKKLFRRYFSGLLKSRSTWDVQFGLTIWRNDLLCIRPRVNLAGNCGFIVDSTHTGSFSYDMDRFACRGQIDFPIVHPNSVARDVEADRMNELRSFGFLPRVATVLGLRLGRFGMFFVNVFRKIEGVYPALMRF